MHFFVIDKQDTAEKNPMNFCRPDISKQASKQARDVTVVVLIEAAQSPRPVADIAQL